MIPTNIHRTQRERLACVYVRQSTQLQVRQHQESAERQYALQERAIALGWPPSAIEIIDEDQGRSGTTAAHRAGFQRLVSGVGLGQVGLVLMLEASRLARNGSGVIALFRNQSKAAEAMVQLPLIPPGRYTVRSVITGKDAGVFGQSDWARGVRIAFPGASTVEVLEVSAVSAVKM